MFRRSAFKVWLVVGIVMISCALAFGIWWASIKGIRSGDTVLWEVELGSSASASFSPDGQTIIAECDYRLCFFDADTGELLNATNIMPVLLRGRTRPVYSHNGKWIAVPGLGGAVIIDSQTTETVRTFSHTPNEEFFSGHFNQDDTRLLTSDSRHQVAIWDLETGEKLISWETGECSTDLGCLLTATFSPDSEQVVTTDAAGHVILWDASNGKVIREFIGHKYGVVQAHFDADGKKLVTTGYFENAHVWDVDSGELLFAIDDSAWFSDAEFSPDGRYIAVTKMRPDPSSIRLYDADTFELVYTYSGYSEYLYDVAFHPNEPWFVAVSEPYIVSYLLPDGFPDN